MKKGDRMRSLSFFSVIFSIFVCFFGAMGCSSAKTFDLAAIKDFARKHSPLLMTYQEDINIQAGEKNIVRSTLFPTIDTKGSYSRYKLKHGVIEGVFGEEQLPSKERFAWDVTFNFVAFSFGKDYFNYKSSQKFLRSKEVSFNWAWQNLSFQLSKIYYSILTIDKTITATKTNIKSLKALEEEIRQKVRVGKLPEVDALKVEVELSKSIDDLSKLETLKEELSGELKRLMGFNFNTSLELSDRSIKKIEKKSFKLEQLLSQAYANRDDLKSLKFSLDGVRYQIKSVKASYLPEIELRAIYAEQAPGTSDFVTDGSAGVVIAMPIFDGFLRKAQIEKFSAQEQKIVYSIMDKQLQIEKEVKTAFKNYQETLVRIKSTERSMRHAKEVLRIEKLKYKLGRTTINFVLEAESALLSASSLFYKAYYDNYIAIENIKLATGTLE